MTSRRELQSDLALAVLDFEALLLLPMDLSLRLSNLNTEIRNSCLGYNTDYNASKMAHIAMCTRTRN